MAYKLRRLFEHQSSAPKFLILFLAGMMWFNSYFLIALTQLTSI